MQGLSSVELANESKDISYSERGDKTENNNGSSYCCH